eukprot:144864-Chlamydomonas_euryale.AAC.4
MALLRKEGTIAAASTGRAAVPLCAQSPADFSARDALLAGRSVCSRGSVNVSANGSAGRGGSASGSRHVSVAATTGPTGRADGAAAIVDMDMTGTPASPSETQQQKHGKAVDWDWAFVLKQKPGRKPAIKRPQRHQWFFCNPRYDPHEPMPRRILPPHAPPSAAHVDDWRVFQSRLGGSLTTKKARAEFVRFLKLRDVDWRNAFHRGLAQHVADFKRQQQIEAERTRQHAWHDYRRQVFERAIAQDVVGSTNS